MRNHPAHRPPVLLLTNVESSWTPQEEADCRQEVDDLAEALRGAGHAVELVEVRQDVIGPLRGHDPREAVIFNWCEGIDGQPTAYDLVAQALDESGFAYTGSGPWTLASTQHKARFKAILDAQGVSTPRWRVFTEARAAKEWTIFPAIVKPVAEHCSCGISTDSVVDDVLGLSRQIDFVMDKFGVGALVEEFVDGREVYASIWGNGSPHALPLYEVDFQAIDDPLQRIVDFESKWNVESLRYQITPERYPSNLDGPDADRARETALAAYRALHCRDYGRIDLRLRDGLPYVVDVNPNCDLTVGGGFVGAAQIAGYNYGAMASQIVCWASQRRPPERRQDARLVRSGGRPA